MTVSTLTNRVTYLGNGSTTSFAVPFKVLDIDHLVVLRLEDITDEVDYTYVGTDFSYSGLGNDSGTLTLNAAVASGYYLEIERVVPYTQELDLVNAGGFYPETVEQQLDLTTMQVQQIAAQSDDIETRALMVPSGQEAPDYEDFAAAFKGDTGGNVESVNTFEALALGLTSRPIGTDRFRTSGYSEPGVGQADYANSADVDEDYVTLHPRTSFLWADGTGAKLAEATRTPYMMGAIGIRAGDTDATMPDDHLALQAFFDDAFHVENRAYVYDPSGDWASSQRLYACYPLNQSASLYQDQAQRRFIGDYKIRPLPLNRQPGGVPMEYVQTIAGYGQTWTGSLHVSCLSETGPIHPYANRRAKGAIQLFATNSSHFSRIFVEGVQRDGVYFDPSLVETTFRAGTPYEVTYPYSNNIGVRIDALHGRWCGAYYGSPATYSKFWSAMSHGGVTGGVFSAASPSSFNNSTSQRTKLTFDDTSDFRYGDYGKTRLELTPAVYGTVAADATAGTLMWSQGNPVTEGLVAGDVLVPQSGANSGKRLEILSFSGTSNRVIKVSSRLQVEGGNANLATEAATAITGLCTRWAPYLVMDVLNSTEILVWPWVADRLSTAGRWTFMHGHVANISGNNTANVSIGTLVGVAVSSTLNAQGLYGPKISTMLAEFSEIGVSIGSEYGNAHLGTVIEHIHAEGCEFNIIQTVSSNSCHVNIKGASNLYKGRTWCMTSKVLAGDALMPARPLNFTTMDLGGEMIRNRQAPSFSGPTSTTFTISNRDGQREIVKAMDGPLTVTLDFDFDKARLEGNAHWARLFWVGKTGAAPTSTCTFGLSAELTFRGWTIEGTNPVSGPTKPCWIYIVFYSEEGRITLTRFDAV